jgi:hypothetical protein
VFPTVIDDTEAMTDVVGHNGEINPVEHRKMDLKADFGSGNRKLVVKNRTDPFAGSATLHFGTSNPSYYMAPLLEHNSLPGGLGLAASKVPDFGPAQLSGLISLYEAPELAQMLAALRRIPVNILIALLRGRFKGSGRDLARWARENGLNTPRGIISAAIGLDLSWKFGMQPVIADVQAVHSAIGRWESKLERVYAERFTTRGRHTSEDTSVSIPYLDYADQIGATGSTCVITRRTTRTDIVGYTRSLKRGVVAQPGVLEWAVIRESLGLNPKASTVWKVLPRSFIIDWFFPICDFLDGLHTNPPNPDWFSVHESWTSSLLTTELSAVTTTKSLKRNDYIITGQDSWQDFAFATRKDYMRSTGVPKALPVYLPQFRMPSLGKWFTLLEIWMSSNGYNLRPPPRGGTAGING